MSTITAHLLIKEAQHHHEVLKKKLYHRPGPSLSFSARAIRDGTHSQHRSRPSSISEHLPQLPPGVEWSVRAKAPQNPRTQPVCTVKRAHLKLHCEPWRKKQDRMSQHMLESCDVSPGIAPLSAQVLVNVLTPLDTAQSEHFKCIRVDRNLDHT